MRTRAMSASVAVLGAGHVGAAIAHTLVLQGIAERVLSSAFENGESLQAIGRANLSFFERIFCHKIASPRSS